jgi:hypothetical protein
MSTSVGQFSFLLQICINTKLTMAVALPNTIVYLRSIELAGIVNVRIRSSTNSSANMFKYVKNEDHSTKQSLEDSSKYRDTYRMFLPDGSHQNRRSFQYQINGTTRTDCLHIAKSCCIWTNEASSAAPPQSCIFHLITSSCGQPEGPIVSSLMLTPNNLICSKARSNLGAAL